MPDLINSVSFGTTAAVIETLMPMPNTNISRALVVIDAAVDDRKFLIKGVLPDADVMVLDRHRDGIAQIDEVLRAGDFRALQIVTHGSEGELRLGNTSLNLSNLLNYATALRSWQVDEISLYACEVASGATGRDFVKQLAVVTGARVAAATTKVGNYALGGTWSLAVQTGAVTTPLMIDSETLGNYVGVFPIANDTWENAITLTLNTPVSGTWNTATNDYQFTTTRLFSGIGQTTTTATGSDAVYKFTATAAGNYSFRITAPATSGNPNMVLYALDSLPASTPGTPLNLTSATILGGANRTNSSSTSAEEIYPLTLTAGQTIYLVADLFSGTSTANFIVEVNQVAVESDTSVNSITNDTPATANNYVFGIEGAIGVSGDKDFFSLGTPASGSRVFAMIDGLAGSSNDFDLRVTTATDTLEYDDSDADTPFSSSASSISGTPLTGVNSYLRVNHFSSTSTSEPYRLYAVVQPSLAAATVETSSRNDTLIDGQSASNNYFYGTLSLATDVDFYTFTARAGDLVFLSLDSNPTRDATVFDGRLALFDAAGTSLVGTNGVNGGSTGFGATSGAGNLAASNPTSPSEGLVYRVLTDGVYFARVNAASTTFGDYLLSVSLNGATGSSSLPIPPLVGIAAQTANTVEGSATPGVFRLSRTGSTASDLTLNYAISGTATNTTDYATLSGVATIAAGQTFVDVTVAANTDLLTEGNETTILTLAAPSGYAIAGSSSATVTIADPTVSIAAQTANTLEGSATPGVFRLSRTGSTASDLTLNYAISGTATNTTDYPTLSGVATIAAGQTFVDVTVAPIDDSIAEASGETVTLTLTAPSDYTVSGSNAATVTIADKPYYTASANVFQNLDLIPGAAGVTSIAALSNTDDAATNIDLGTNTFRFYGTTYTGASSLFVSSNALISFGAGVTTVSNTDLTDTSLTQAAIAPFWDDLVTNKNLATGALDDLVLYQLRDVNGDNTPDQLIVEWNNVQFFSGTNTDGMTFQAVLQLNTGGSVDGNIIFNYIDLTSSAGTSATATVGVKAAGTQTIASINRTLVAFNNTATNPLIGAGKSVLLSAGQNTAPIFLNLQNQVTTLAENTDTTSQIKVADLQLVDDGLGTNNFSLSGADASNFTIIGNALYLNSGTTLNYEAKTSYNVTINVDDTTVGSTPMRQLTSPCL